MAGGGRRSPHARERGGGGGEKGKHHGGGSGKVDGLGGGGFVADGGGFRSNPSVPKGALITALQAKLTADPAGTKGLAAGGLEGGSNETRVTRGAEAKLLGKTSVSSTPPTGGATVAELKCAVADEDFTPVVRCHPKCFYGVCDYHSDEDVEEAANEFEDLLGSGECRSEPMVLADGSCGLANDTAMLEVGAPSLNVASSPKSGSRSPSADCSRSSVRQDHAMADQFNCTQGARGNAAQNLEQFWGSNRIPPPAAEQCTPDARRFVAEKPNVSPLRHDPAANGGLDGQHSRKPKAWSTPVLVPFDLIEPKDSISKGPNMVIMDSGLVKNSIARLNLALVGKVIGRKIPFMFLNGELQRRWNHFGSFQTMLITDDYFICTFDSEAARDAVITGGPWIISGCLIGVDRWKPELDPYSLKGFTSPIWVRLPSLPLSCWDKKNIGRFASMIGEPLWIDANTNCRARCSYARFCVRHDLSEPLLEGVWVDADGLRFYQRFEYEGIASLCFKCGRIGHKDSVCPSTAPSSLDTQQNVDQPLRNTPPTVPQPARPNSAPEPKSSFSEEVITATDSPTCSAADRGHGPWNLVVNKRNLKIAKAAAAAKSRNKNLGQNSKPRGKDPVVANSLVAGRVEIQQTAASPRLNSGSPQFRFKAVHGQDGSSSSDLSAQPILKPQMKLGMNDKQVIMDKDLSIVLFTAGACNDPSTEVIGDGKRKRKKSKSNLSCGGDASPSVDQ